MSRDYKVYLEDILEAASKIRQFTAGLRDILIHEYFGVNVEVIWDIVQHKLPDLEKAARTLLTAEA